MMATFADAAARLGQGAEISMMIKATVVLLVGLAAARLARRAPASVRHLVLVATFGGLIALPLALVSIPRVVAIDLPVAGFDEPQVPSRAAPSRAAPSRAAPSRAALPSQVGPGTREGQPVAVPEPGVAGRSQQSWRGLARSAWATGTFVLLASLGVAVWQVARIRRGAVPWLKGAPLMRTLAAEAGVRRPVDLVFSETVAAPLTSGFVRPAIVLPVDASTWTDVDVRRALVHELEHVRRRDWATQLVARGVCALYWFHPLVWIARRQLCLEAERACDDAVVAGVEATDYAEQLVLLAQRLSHAASQPALAMAKRSDLSARVSAILDATQARGRVGTRSVATILSAMAAIVLTLAPLRAVTASPSAGASVARNASTGAAALEDRRRSRPLDRAAYEAAETGDVASLTSALDAGANVDAALDGDGSPLIAAARAGQIAAVRVLLDRGANLDLGVPGDGNALIIAAREGHAAVVELLLDRGASIDLVVPGDENALIQASGHGELAVVKLLIARGADVNARVWVDSGDRRRPGEWRTPLSMARQGRHEAVARLLVSSGAHE